MTLARSLTREDKINIAFIRTNNLCPSKDSCLEYILKETSVSQQEKTQTTHFKNIGK
jgi:hypothetical protein